MPLVARLGNLASDVIRFLRIIRINPRFRQIPKPNPENPDSDN